MSNHKQSRQSRQSKEEIWSKHINAIHPPWSEAFEESARSPSKTYDVDANLSQNLNFEHVENKNDSFIFHKYTRNRGDPETSILHEDPQQAFLKDCPPTIIDILRQYSGKLVLAGGSVLGLVSKNILGGADYDMFIVNSTEQEGRDMMMEICKNFGVDQGYVCITRNALTMLASKSKGGEGKGEEECTVQIILRRFDTPADVLTSFDMPPCMVGAYFENEKEEGGGEEGIEKNQGIQGVEKNQGIQIIAKPEWVACMKTLAFPINPFKWGTSSVFRVFKYINKGFDVCIPGLSRIIAKRTIQGNQGSQGSEKIQGSQGNEKNHQMNDEDLHSLLGLIYFEALTLYDLRLRGKRGGSVYEDVQKMCSILKDDDYKDYVGEEKMKDNNELKGSIVDSKHRYIRFLSSFVVKHSNNLIRAIIYGYEWMADAMTNYDYNDEELQNVSIPMFNREKPSMNPLHSKWELIRKKKV